MTHSPGPWRAEPECVHQREEGFVIRCASGTRIAELHGYVSHPGNAANARLLAAAPELLEALEMVRDADDDCKSDGFHTIPPMARAKIDAAIAKATKEPS
jgi:hypothetical protein